MLEILREVCKCGKYVAIYHDDSNGNFAFGRVLAVNEEFIAVYSISKNAEYNGIVISRTESVIRIETDNQYIEKMKKLIDSSLYDITDQISIDESRIVESVLLMAKENKKIVSIDILNREFDDITGFVDIIDDGICMIQQINDYGYQDGISYVNIRDISEVLYDTIYEQRSLKVWNCNYTENG